MKKGLVKIACAIILFCSCNKDDNPTLSPTLVNNTIVSGTWRITHYWDTDHDETTSFNGYVFTFGSNNVVTATKNAATVSGSWITATDDSQIKFVLGFTQPASFAELNDDWHVVERTDNKIRLTDESGGNGGTDLLTFEKN